MSVADNLEAARWIDENSSGSDKVFVWGFDPMVNFVAHRQTVSRFLYDYPFAVHWGDARYETELMTALHADPPAFFLVDSKDATPQVTGNNADSRELFEKFGELKSFVDQNYVPAATLHRYDVYRRKP
jgi:hypothetical protein